MMNGRTETSAAKEEARPVLVPKLRFPDTLPFRNKPTIDGCFLEIDR